MGQTWFAKMTSISLVLRIIVSIVLGIAVALISPELARMLAILGDLFVGALKALAPILVFLLVMSSIANQKTSGYTGIRPVIALYLLGTMAASLVAVVVSSLFPVSLSLVLGETQAAPPAGIGQVLQLLLFNMIQNPVEALMTANFIGVLTWSVAVGLVLRSASESSKLFLHDVADAVGKIVQFVIQWAPFGIFGLVANSIVQTGFSTLLGYSQLIMVLVGCMMVIALIVNPLLVYWKIRRNPYPLIFQCIRESGVTAFFTRSSAANIPVNLALCEKLRLSPNTYSVSIPLGATINMAGASITITVMTLAAVNTLGIAVDLPTAVVLSFVAAVSACGASGIAGGSLLLIPLACSLFGVSQDVAMQVVAAGFIIGVVQDSFETALNSSTDVVFTAAACLGTGQEADCSTKLSRGL